MQLLRFKCKVTGRTYQEEHASGTERCSVCAFQSSKVELEEEAVQHATFNHCLGTNCINRRTVFVEVTE